MAKRFPLPLLIGVGVGAAVFLSGRGVRRGALAAVPGQLTPNFNRSGSPGTVKRRLLFRPRSAALEQYAREVARAEGIPEEGFIIQLWTESQFSPTAVSSAGAVGVGQFMPGAGVDYGLITMPAAKKDAYYEALRDARAAGESTRPIDRAMLADPATRDNRTDGRASIRAAARYMKNLRARMGNWSDAVASYNRGSGGVRRDKARGRRFPEETAHYVAIIAPYYGENVPASPQIPQSIVSKYQHPLSATVTL